MAIRPCDIKIDCPGSDWPISNYSTEGDDPFPSWYSVDYNHYNPPIIDNDFEARGCLFLCTSAVSQEEADLCAQRQAVLCSTPPDDIWYSTAQTCSVTCVDGTEFHYDVPAGAFVGDSQANANSAAYQYACSKAAEQKMCLSEPHPCACWGVNYTSVVTSSTNNESLSWAVVGSLPDGLDLIPNGSSAGIVGTPTTPGMFSFAIVAATPQGYYSIKVCTIIVLKITTVSLDPIVVGSPYSLQLNALGGTSNYFWSIVDGTLPNGLTLSTSGLISGTPTVTLSGQNITFRVRDIVVSPCVCDAEYTFTSGCSFPGCETEPPIPLASGWTEDVGIGFAEEYCYCLLLTQSDDYSSMLVHRYNQDTNDLVYLFTITDYVRSGVVYDTVNKKFVFASDSTVYIFDPVSETITNSFPTGSVWCLDLVYVPQKNLVYANMRVGATRKIGEINVALGTSTILGDIPSQLGNITYAPTTDSLYGFDGTGYNLVKFDLVSNTATNVSTLEFGIECCWDSDRNLLIVFANNWVKEFNVLTDTFVYNAVHNLNYYVGFFPFYSSDLKCCFVIGSHDPSGEDGIFRYDTTSHDVTLIRSDYGYTGLVELEDASVMTTWYDLVDNNIVGFRKLCLNAPYAYFKCDETSGPVIVDSISAKELERSDLTATFPSTSGFIGTAVRIGAWPEAPLFKAANYYAPLADATHWDFSETSWTIRLWTWVSGDTAWLISALSTPDQFRVLWVNTGFTTYIEFSAYLNGSWETITEPMGASAWHRVVVWYEKGVGIGLKVDTGADVTLADTDLIGSGGQRLMIGGPLAYGAPPSGFSIIDEVSIWNYKLSSQELVYDWNSGFGRTWPW